mgnify:CR=1 FL=1
MPEDIIPTTVLEVEAAYDALYIDHYIGRRAC